MRKSTKRINPTKATAPDVALDSPIIKENLPFPYVYYPNHYGTFFSFSERKNSELYLCSCSLDAIENHFLLSGFEFNGKWIDELITTKLSRHFTSNVISLSSLKKKGIEKVFTFKEKLCHRCNLATPTLRYCHEIYGGNFKQYYGWYINMNKYKFGFREYEFIENVCPSEIKVFISEQKKYEMKFSKFWKMIQQKIVN